MSLEGLNNQQRAAATAGPEGAILVNAGPGSGKTKVLTERIAWLVQEHGVPPAGILAMTFSVKAAEEMRFRSKVLPGEQWEELRIGTFHKVCRDLLNEMSGPELHPWKPGIAFIKSEGKRLDVVEAAMREVDPDRNQFSVHGDEILRGISFAKGRLISPENYRDRPADPWDVVRTVADKVARVYPHYQARMQTINAMDFDDQLMQTVLLLQQKAGLRERTGQRFQYVLVDEFQDLNRAQYVLTRLFAQRGNLFVVGDEDQTIYSWRGADARNFEYFRRDWPQLEEFTLRRNYRSKRTILEPAQRLVRNNPNRQEKGLFTRRQTGAPVYVQEAADEGDEANFVAKTIKKRGKRQEWSDYAVLYRNGYQGEALAKALARSDIPFREADDDTPLLRYVEIRDMLAYLRLCVDPNDRISFQRVINAPRRGIGPASLEAFFAWLNDEGLRVGEALMALLDDARPQALGDRLRQQFQEFATLLYRDWRLLAARGQLSGLLDAICEQTAYHRYIDTYSGSTAQGESAKARERKRNIALFRAQLERAEAQGHTLQRFLKGNELAQALSERGKGAVILSTLHRAKGLEFPVVFVTGLEEGLLPDWRAMEDAARMEEERRLFYVGMTRAEDELYLTWAARRDHDTGLAKGDRLPSRFLQELEPAPARQGGRQDRGEHKIYRFDHPEGAYCYIGLTRDLGRRIVEHCTRADGPLYDYLSRHCDNPGDARRHFQIIDRAAGLRQAERLESAHIFSALLASCEPAGPLPRNRRTAQIDAETFARLLALAQHARLTPGPEARRRLEREIDSLGDSLLRRDDPGRGG